MADDRMPCATASRESAAHHEASDGAELPLPVFEPAEDTPTRAGIVLFHGGGLTKGAPDDLAPHSRLLAAHGIFTVPAGYRLLGRSSRSTG